MGKVVLSPSPLEIGRPKCTGFKKWEWVWFLAKFFIIHFLLKFYHNADKIAIHFFSKLLEEVWFHLFPYYIKTCCVRDFFSYDHFSWYFRICFGLEPPSLRVGQYCHCPPPLTRLQQFNFFLAPAYSRNTFEVLKLFTGIHVLRLENTYIIKRGYEYWVSHHLHIACIMYSLCIESN